MNAEKIFVAAVEKKTPAERAAYLEGACGQDAALRAQVEGLLKAHEEAGSFLEQPLFEPTPTVDQPPNPERPGTMIGPYKLLQQIGEGGMGTVFMAEQTEPVQRKVALKLIKSGMDSRQVIARFEAERQALAMMDHPHIARVLDAGTTDAGRPYFVMELVKGVPITRYCDEHHLTPRQRLELFVPVCQAVQHAHQKGIIHRDLKPSNVMVCLYDGKPVPKVIDFGVAKAAGPRLTEKTLFTELGQVVGTLEYMSPEQAELNQLDIDTRSDIYSLGVLLYELLTGTTPLERRRFQAVAFLEVLRLIREEESPKPSTRLSTTEGLPFIAANRGLEPKKLSGLVRGELDWIVMKTLEKDRNRRYETANGLAMDVQRYLADEPVQACPPSAGYRLRKFVRRNRGPVLAATLVLVALIGGIIGTTWQAIRATTAEGLAENTLKSERTTQKALDEARKEQDQHRRRINRELSLTLVEAAGKREKARAARLGDQTPLIQFRETMRGAETLAASELAEPVLVGRVRALTAEWKQDEADHRMVARLEEIRLNKGIQQESFVISYSGSVRPAYEAAFREYGLPVFDVDIEEAARRIVESPIRDWLTAALDDCADNDVELCKRLLPIAQRAEKSIWRQKYFDARIRYDQPAMLQLAKQQEVLAQPPATLHMLAQRIHSIDLPFAVELLREAQRRNPGEMWINHYLADFLRNSRGPWNQALREEIVGFRRTALAARSESLALRIELGRCLRDCGHYADAIAVFGQAIRLRPDHSDTYLSRGLAYGALRQEDKELADYNKAIELEANNGEPYHARATYYLRFAEWDKVVADESRYLALVPKANVIPHAWTNRARAFQKLGMWEKAVADYEEVVKSPGTSPPRKDELAWLLATCPEQKVRNPERAVLMAKEALESGFNGLYSSTLGVAQYRTGDWKAAITALDNSEKLGGSRTPINELFLAMAYQKLGDRGEALKHYGKAVQWLEKTSSAPEQRADELRFRSEAEEVLELKKK